LINKEIFTRLQGNRSRQSVYQRIARKRKEFDNMISTEDAAYILAAQQGEDLYKYLSFEDVERIRLIITQKKRTFETMKETPRNQKRRKKEVAISFSEKDIPKANLPSNVANDALKMAQVYPYFYVLENSIRHFISKILSDVFGENWWNLANISSKVTKTIIKRMSDDEKNKWHGRRGAHPIFYTDMSDLRRIMEHNWQYFQGTVIPNANWIELYLGEIIERLRNTIMHCNPLSNDDISRLKTVYKDWIRILEG